MKTRLALILLYCLASMPTMAAGVNVDRPKPGVAIQYDDRNSLMWEPFRQNEGTTITNGIWLKYQIDGKQFKWTDQFYDFAYPIDSPLLSIRYFNPRGVWLISQLDNRFGGALLVDLARGKITKGYAINGPYSISPNNRNIAYTYPIGAHEYDKAIFVNNVMVYPKIEMGFNTSDSAEKFKESYGWQFKKPEPNRIGLVYDISWVGDDGLRFLIEEIENERELTLMLNGGKAAGQFYYCSVSGLKTAWAGAKPDPTKIKVSKEKLEYPLYFFRDIYELEHGGGSWHGKQYRARAQWIGTPHLQSRDHLVMAVKTEQYYLGEIPRKKFPKEKFYGLKLGVTKEEALKLFEPDASQWSDRGDCIFAFTEDKYSYVYCWYLWYDSNGIITIKCVSHEKS